MGQSLEAWALEAMVLGRAPGSACQDPKGSGCPYEPWSHLLVRGFFEDYIGFWRLSLV